MGKVSRPESGIISSVDDASRDRAWGRIATDLRATTGRTLVLRMRPGAGAWIEFEVDLDGSGPSYGTNFPMDEESFVAFLADYLQESVLDEEIWGGWPLCPLHNTHPLRAVVGVDGTATWVCPNGHEVARIGTFADSA